MDRAPAIRLLKEPSRRIRFLTRDQAMMLLRELPPHLRAMAAFMLSTGLRRTNVTGLTWEQVDLALAILHAQVGNHSERVFTYEGRPVFQVSSMAWYKALKRAGIENFRWHDLRHTWGGISRSTPMP